MRKNLTKTKSRRMTTKILKQVRNSLLEQIRIRKLIIVTTIRK
jgi:hypothetical protein